jgi:hypothetical protein
VPVQLSGSLMNKFCLALGILFLLAAIGCGSGNGIVVTNPTGNFSNASLSGQYVYEVHGSLVSGQPYREFGVFTADGAGHITSGTDDFTTTNSGGVLTSSTTGSYTVANDGTGFISLGPTVLSTSVNATQVTFAITLASSSKIALMEADSFADGAGTSELQDPTALATTPSGTFVFRVHQNVSAQGGGSSASQVGAMTVSNGAITGSMDQNLGGTTSQLTLTSGTMNAPVSGLGSGSFTDSSSVTTNFFYYVVNSGKFVMLVSTPSAVGSGSAEAQSGAVGNGLSGSYAFGSRGDDNFSTGFFDGVATVGQFTANAGAISGLEDSMQDGTYSASIPLSSCYTAASTGRVVVTNCSGSTSQIFWMINPSRAFFLNNDSTIIEDGTADLQTASAFSASSLKGQFALVMDGIDLTPGEALARVGTLQFDGSSKLVLIELANASGTGSGAQSPGALSGTYSVASNGRVTGTLSGSTLNLVMYAVSGSNAYALQTDVGTNTSGTVELQH